MDKQRALNKRKKTTMSAKKERKMSLRKELDPSHAFMKKIVYVFFKNAQVYKNYFTLLLFLNLGSAFFSLSLC